MITYICKRQSDFAISRWGYFHKTSPLQSFAKIKPSQKFPNLQYLVEIVLSYSLTIVDSSRAVVSYGWKYVFFKYW